MGALLHYAGASFRIEDPDDAKELAANIEATITSGVNQVISVPTKSGETHLIIGVGIPTALTFDPEY